jgi:D-alanyl-D-alanine carboxypeptidase/D-alanyl-D-alanine-endopeptidase (penicillin-binding protein 4)
MVATHDSPTLAEIVTITNKHTKNLWADQLLIMIGLDIMGSASRDDGVAVVRKFLRGLGLSDSDLRIVDGSGLSRLNLASPDFMTLLLVHSRHRSWYADFAASLPVAGQDGTLDERMKGSSAEGRIKAKTGSMSSVRALSGIAETLSGRTLAFSVMVNGYLGSGGAIDATIDRFCELLTRYDG